MNVTPGPWELLILIPILLWQFGLPLALIYGLWQIWRRLQRVEEQLQAIAEQGARREL